MDCNSQTNGLDYWVTFGLLVNMNSFRVLLSLAVNLYWPLHQFEVKKCFSPYKARGGSHVSFYLVSRIVQIVEKYAN